jgi:integrase
MSDALSDEAEARVWMQFVVDSGLPRIRFHDLRHAHATHLLMAGVHPKIASERLGHSKVGITLDLYSHVMPGMQEDAAAKVDAALIAARKPR